ncbi:PTS glucose transporter subunit IIA [Robertmurraya sp. DFI.2.37]|uniref:PTS sugar transporter subunit IIA n=1 Tax=Robertmurraya sp. DFI.2.37 TaxID=3031819 RepID=UPI0012466B6B|nr:PTS glucose transporter subunit IIA [Robertmurraya sp. DFI.2.37]MDF1508882.1 PTS glucose transporter subunit IIA [Robertmurraya sp. DFI.2.37]
MFNSSKVQNMFKRKQKDENVIKAPIEGEVWPLSNVNDPVFSTEMMGKGVAILPKRGRVVSPVNGKVVSVFETKHAVTLASDNGAEILIHVGLDTVSLNGQYFEALICSGEKVKIGDPLLQFDIDKIKRQGFDLISPLIICNTDSFREIVSFTGKEVEEMETVIELIKN